MAIKYGRDSLTMSKVLDALKTENLEIRKNARMASYLRSEEGVRKRAGKEKRGVKETTDGYESLKVLMVSHKDIQDAWIMDSGCTFHIAPNRDFLINFQKSDGGKILLGDNDTCDLKRTSSIQIVTHDRMIKILTNVRGILRNGLYMLESTTISSSATTTLEQQKQQTVDHVVKEERTLIDEGVCNDSIASNSKKQQKDAMETKLFILQKNLTWSLVTKPLFRNSFKQSGSSQEVTVSLGARLVAKVLPAHRFKYR
ncbi:Retrovirus-related Pol polyprotein from transposon TNT 1-94 [Cucumis melo var. makuwa]|uniref:Retrovirus-related Pol polyprotein from transposon TNT 1-94 n=1 Tax=Cucumis melo var. makuwa TaxID=1194695 RepID=A0A5A7VHR7_CUCMM|nr:Retrovirus-related Pol polyprotein from transposon TNT 1-94 [Cucumis melo var. makuwa]